MSDTSNLDLERGRDPAALRPTPARAGLDNEWITPPDLIAALVERVLPALDGIGCLPIWECSAGNGVIVDALRMAQRRVYASDIAPLRDDITRHDFLNDEPPLEVLGGILCTNPPFARSGLGDHFLHRGLELLDRGDLSAVVFLQRGGADATDARAEIFNRATAQFLRCWRPRWIPGTTEGARWWFSWFVWHADNAGPPITIRVRKGEVQHG
jgi:hypothetical protein